MITSLVHETYIVKVSPTEKKISGLEFQWNKRHIFPLEKGNSNGIPLDSVEFHLILVKIPMGFPLIPVEIPLDSSDTRVIQEVMRTHP